MANEITINMKLRFNQDGTDFTVNPAIDLSSDVTGSAVMHQRMDVGVSEEVIPLGDCGRGGWFIAINHDSTNFVHIRGETAGANLVKLSPGEPAMFRLSSDEITPYFIADTGTCEVEFWLFEK